MLLSRRKFVLTGLVAAPAVVAFDALMPIKMYRPAIAKYIGPWQYGRDYEDGFLYYKWNGLLKRVNIRDDNETVPLYRNYWNRYCNITLLGDVTLVGGNNIQNAVGHIIPFN
jgi:hypothetical protein